ncbi:hypothetical protein BJ166DRAFT_509176 [Pestalotiopsis sp. NC0098]|nr:hypothetical protein BJ166DRAFT_509176 [Pestalotiopsis sp. NC0098]
MYCARICCSVFSNSFALLHASLAVCTALPCLDNMQNSKVQSRPGRMSLLRYALPLRTCPWCTCDRGSMERYPMLADKELWE